MAFQSGTVTAFSGTNGLLQALLDFVLGTEVTGESLSGSGTSWSGTLAHSPVGLGRLVINYTISGTDYTATDDGSGNITGDHINSGSITYSTGAYSITFDTSPDSIPIADYIYGDPGQDWREELNQNTKTPGVGGTEPFGSDCKEVILSNTGLSGQERVIIGIRETKYPSAGYYSWNLNGYTYYQDGETEWDFNSSDHGLGTYDNTYNAYTYHPSMPLIDGTMYYWFYSNQQRIIVFVKAQSNYEMCYLGFGRRFGNPSDYPYPLVVGGSTYQGTVLQSSTGGGHVAFWHMPNSGGYHNVWIINPSNSYLDMRTSDTQLRIVPGMDLTKTSSEVDKTKDNKVLMCPVYLMEYRAGAHDTLMDLDGLYHVFCNQVQSEDVVNFDGKSYRIFQNIFRTDYHDFCAIEEGVAVTTTTTTTTTTSTSTTTTTT